MTASTVPTSGPTRFALGALALSLGLALPATAQTASDKKPAATTLVLPTRNGELQAGLNRVMREQPFRRLVARHQLSVTLVDLTDGEFRYAGVEDGKMRYAASLPKIAVLLTVFDRIEAGAIAYTPELRATLEAMIRRSDNHAATEMIQLVGFDAIARTLRDPRYQLYGAKAGGGLWVGRDYGGWIGLWRRDPIHNISHGATARQVARFLVMMDRGQLVSPWASAEMKDIMGHPAIHHKFVRGLDRRPNSVIFRKSGSWRTWHADAAIVERNGKRYVAVALLEGNRSGAVLAQLITRLDDLIPAPSPPTEEPTTTASQ